MLISLCASSLFLIRSLGFSSMLPIEKGEKANAIPENSDRSFSKTSSPENSDRSFSKTSRRDLYVPK